MPKLTPDIPADHNMPIVFDLRVEPWITVMREDGTRSELGLRDLLARAHEIKGIHDAMPTVEFGLYRLLIALVLDVFEPRDTRDLGELLDRKCFDTGLLDAYLAEHSGRFDLFHPQHPFLQSAGMAGEAAKPLAGLVHALPSGTNAGHFHHLGENDFAASPAAAVRLLTTIAPFMTAGGAGLSPSLNGAPPWYGLILGDNVFETLLLNCPVMADLLPDARPNDDLPAWRILEPVTAKRREGAGLRESMTWQPRRIQLVLGAGGVCSVTGESSPVLVRQMKFAPGWGAGFLWRDPNVPYRVGSEGPSVMRPQEDRPVWRDVGPLALLRASDYQPPNGQKFKFERPALVSQFAASLKFGDVAPNRELRLRLYGMRTDLKMKVFEWYREDLHLPLLLLLETAPVEQIQNEMERADVIAYSLGRAIKKAYPRDGAGNSVAFDELISLARRSFWDALEPAFIGDAHSLLRDLAELSRQKAPPAEVLARLQSWHATLKTVGWAALNGSIEHLDADANALERQVIARNTFAKSLSLVLDPDRKSKTRNKETS